MLSDKPSSETDGATAADLRLGGVGLGRRSPNLLDELHVDDTLQRQRAAIRESARVASEAQARLESSREQMLAQDQARQKAEERARAELAANIQARMRKQAQDEGDEPEQQLDLLSSQMDALRNKVAPSPATQTPPHAALAPHDPAPAFTPAGPAQGAGASRAARKAGGADVGSARNSAPPPHPLPPQGEKHHSDFAPSASTPAPAPVPSAVPAQAIASPFGALGFENIVGAILRGWKTVLLFGVAGAALAGAYGMTLPNKYLSVAELLIEPRGVRVLNDTVTPSGLNSEATVAYAQSQVRIMSSMAVLQPVIDELDLVSDPEFNGASTTVVGSILKRVGGLFGSSDAEPANRMAAVRKSLSESVIINRINTTFNIQVGALTQDPEKSARIANAIARTYINDESSANSRAARGANESLEARIQVLRAKVKEAERAVQAHRQAYDLVDADGKLTTDVQIARLNEQLALARVQTGDARTRAQAAEAANPRDALAGNLPASISSGSIQQLRIDYNRAKSQLRRLESKLGERHPKILEAVAEVESAREAIESEVARIVRSVRNDYDRAVAREQELEGQLQRMKASSASVSDAKVRLRELQATLDANREIYRTVLNRSRQTGEQENIRAQSTRLLSAAVPADSKTSPNRKMLTATGGVLGSFLGVAIALLPLFWSVLAGLVRLSSRSGAGQPHPRRGNAETGAQDTDLYGTASPHPSPRDERTRNQQAAGQTERNLPLFKQAEDAVRDALHPHSAVADPANARGGSAAAAPAAFGFGQPAPAHRPVDAPPMAPSVPPPTGPSSVQHPNAYRPAPGMPGYVLYPVPEGSVPPLAASADAPHQHAPARYGQRSVQQPAQGQKRPQGPSPTDRT